MRNFRSACFALAALALGFAACSGDDEGTNPTDGSDGGTDAASAFDADPPPDDSDTGPVDPPPCNTVANAAPVVNATVIDAAMPSGEGGQVRPGTYYATSVVYHRTGADANDVDEPWKQTYVVTATTLELVWESPSGALVTGSATYTTSGDEMTILQSCPEETETVATYTATETELRFFDAADRRVITLTKQ